MSPLRDTGPYRSPWTAQWSGSSSNGQRTTDHEQSSHHRWITPETIVPPLCPIGSMPAFCSSLPWPSVAAACDWITASGRSRIRSCNWLLVLTRSSISLSSALYSSSASPRRSWRIVAWISSRSVLGALPQAAEHELELGCAVDQVGRVVELEP